MKPGNGPAGRGLRVVLVIAALAASALSAHATSRFTPAQLAEVEQRWALAQQIVQRLAPEAAQMGLAPGWQTSTMLMLLASSSRSLKEIGVSGGYQQVVARATDRSAASRKLLGDPGDDLVFKPFTPCRYLDTRFVGGKINGIRTYDLAAGGGGGTCGFVKDLAGVANEDQIGALAFNVAYVDTSAGAPGFLTVRPAGSTQLTAILNWFVASPSAQDSNAAVASINQAGPNEIEILTSGPVHVIMDLLGAFVSPHATPLDCVRVQGTRFAIAPNSSNSASNAGAAPSCPAGYLALSASARSATSDAGGTTPVGMNSLHALTLSGATDSPWNGTTINCKYGNSNAFDVYGQCDVLCCRLPGH